MSAEGPQPQVAVRAPIRRRGITRHLATIRQKGDAIARGDPIQVANPVAINAGQVVPVDRAKGDLDQADKDNREDPAVDRVAGRWRGIGCMSIRLLTTPSSIRS